MTGQSGRWLFTHGPALVLFVVGFLLFAGAGSAFVVTSGPGAVTQSTSALGLFDVTYSTSSVEVDSQSVGDMSSGSASFEVGQANVTAVVVTVECTDQAGGAAPFNVRVEVEGPNDTTADPQSGQCGQPIVVEVAVAPVPPSATVPGDTEPEARAALAPSANATKAQGTWEVRVSGSRQGDPIGLPVARPTGTVTIEVDQWTPRFAAVQA
jgi:hypothetical protein